MNKNKPFVFVAVLVILFIMGNWVTSAQATSASVIAATPMPTGTPISTPVVPPGEIPSLEEQDKIKSVIQAYFDIRYRALSVSDANDFKQNGFGDLISDTPEAKAFLRDELGKLAVEIKHAELNRLRYVDYKYSLEFGNISVVMPSQNAVVSATEQNEVTYELSKELRPEEPIVSQHANIEHVIVLRNEQGKWRIISDDYNDYLWKMLRQSGKSTEEILRTMKASSDASIQRNTIMSTSTLSADSSTHSYDRAGAVDYARKYWETYNPDYYDYKNDGGDCTNFISQAIYEGGNASMSIPAVLPPPSTGGDTNWYYLDYLHRARAWNFVDAFYEFATTRGWGEGPQGYQVNTLDELLPGDIIQYDWEGNGSWDHSVIVVDKVGGYPYVDSHTPDKEHELYTAFSDYNPNVSQIRFIHIEQSDGYPPVKATIEQEPGDQAGKSSNDAGTNPLNSCSFSLDGPEIYFGLCPDGSSSSGGFRFKNIPIPHGTVIKYAYLTFTVDGPYSSPLDINIYGENAPDSAPFTDTNQPKDRSLIGPIPWPITDTWQIGQRRTTPNLSPIMNVIVGNGWQYGNSLSFIFKDPGPNTGLRRVVTFDRASWDIQYGPLFPAKLIAAYEIQDENPSNTHPRVSSVIRAENFTSPTKSPTVNFTVTFTEPVTGVDITDFKLTEIPEEGNTIAEYSVTDVSPINNPPGTYNDTYNVIVNTGTGDGVIRLDVLDDNTIVDADSNPLNGGFITGESFVIDKTAPFAFFIGILPPSVNPTNAASVDFWVYFNEPVVGVDTVGPTFDDFSLQIDGVTGASIASVARVRGDQYYVIVNTGNGNGTISLKLENSGAIRDYATNPLHVFGSSTSEPYTINKDAPTVLSSLRASANPTDATNANFTITFSETVTGVDASDFALTTSGISGATITSVSGSGNTYTATVNTGSGDGTIRLDIVDDDTIVDEDGNPLGIIGLGNGNFSAGEAYNVVKTVPIVVSIVRSSINPTSYYNVKYTVTFSKSVTGVDLSDFILTATGVSGATISGVSGSGKSYTVTINTGSGSGTIRLDVIDDDSIHESIPLGGTGIGNGNFTSGETYNVDKTAISSTVSKSADTNDGFCDSDCSLREALATAAPGDTITFDSALSGGTIRVTSTLTISRNITIDGSALAVTITISGDTNNNGTGDVQVLMVNSGVIANLNNLTIAKSKFYGVKNYGSLGIAVIRPYMGVAGEEAIPF